MPERINPVPVDALPTSVYRVAYFDKKPESWAAIKNRILGLHRQAFPDIDDLEGKLQRAFTNPESVTALLYDRNAVVGYTFAGPIPYYDNIQHRHIKTAYADTIVIDKRHRGRNLRLLIGALETELQRQGFEQIEASFVVENGFAEAVERYCGRQGRLLFYPHGKELDHLRKDRRHLLISLAPPLPRQQS